MQFVAVSCVTQTSLEWHFNFYLIFNTPLTPLFNTKLSKRHNTRSRPLSIWSVTSYRALIFPVIDLYKHGRRRQPHNFSTTRIDHNFSFVPFVFTAVFLLLSVDFPPSEVENLGLWTCCWWGQPSSIAYVCLAWPFFLGRKARLLLVKITQFQAKISTKEVWNPDGPWCRGIGNAREKHFFLERSSDVKCQTGKICARSWLAWPKDFSFTHTKTQKGEIRSARERVCEIARKDSILGWQGLFVFGEVGLIVFIKFEGF